LFTTIAYNTGAEFSLDTLGRQAQVQKNTLKKYLEYLEAAFLIKIVRRIDQSGKRFQRDNFFKIYLTNPSLRSALFSPITATDDMIGQLVETAIFAQWMHADWFTPWYARWNSGEVDIVGLHEIKLKPVWAAEIKWSNRYYEKPNELKSLIKFVKENNLKQPIVTSIDKEGVVSYDDIEFFFISAASYAYTLSKNILDNKSSTQTGLNEK
jgi:predicted AAA+ superfamily ATPase